MTNRLQIFFQNRNTFRFLKELMKYFFNQQIFVKKSIEKKDTKKFI